MLDIDCLYRFHKWREMTREECISNAEVFVWQRAIKLPDFPPKNVCTNYLFFISLVCFYKAAQSCIFDKKA